MAAHVFSAEHRRKLSEAHRPIVPWNKGLKGVTVAWNKGVGATDEARAKMSAHVFSEEHKRHLSESHMGGPASNTSWKNGHHTWNKGKSWSPEIIEKLSVAHLGQTPWIKGKHQSEATKEKLRKALSGERSAMWRGGISTTPYAPGFTKELKAKIKERDGFTCMICGSGENGRAHVIHHVDYKKNNHSASNLVTLCPTCHSKTNHRREYWTNHFKSLKEEL